MNVSLILTTFNEEAAIGKLLDSLSKQTFQPAELIIVDARSTDKTVQIINQYTPKLKFSVKIYSKNLNRSKARNLAIGKANNDIIAVTDAGNILDKNWLKNLIEPFKLDNKIDSVAGFYIALTPTLFSQALAPFVATNPKEFDPETYLPSSRSVAFTKNTWKKVGKYPDELNYCEDLIFAQKLKQHSNMHVEKKALVYWIQHETFGQFFNQIANYAKGDVLAFYKPHIRKILTIYARYAVILLFPQLIILYLIWSILKMYPRVADKRALVYTPALQITADMAVIYGSIRGLVEIHLKKITNKSIE